MDGVAIRWKVTKDRKNIIEKEMLLFGD